MTGQSCSSTVCGLLAASLTLAAPSAFAQSPQFLGTYQDWNVYQFADGGETICYIASEPTDQEGDYTRRGRPAVLVTRRPSNPVVDEVSVQPGYSYLDGSEVDVQVDGESEFKLFTRGEHAWAKSEQADEELIGAMRGGADMTVRGTSIKNTYSLDTYSLIGFTAAYEAMAEACAGEQS